ncbi:hypothetical protein U1769_04290 [Sphingomonas sp. ZT3P38]|uniref:hypothetical protein n=1 Tax=Parasphingomonas zepuensis TaxID=3096161 RepID=UPI002FCA0A79
MKHSAMEASYTLIVPALIVAEEGAPGSLAEEAVALVGARMLGRIDWQGVAADAGQAGALGLIVVEAEDVPDEKLAVALPRIAALALDTEARVVVALADGQIDLVAAHLFGSHVELLCAPTLADRVAALAMALMPRGTQLHDSRSDAESSRLRRLNKEVARIAEVLARLTREEEGDSTLRSAGLKSRPGHHAALPDGDSMPVSAREVRDVIRARRLRDQYFQRGLFEDPAWDMLLDLFAAELEETRVSVSSLCIAAAVAPTTALRWIAKMTEAGVFVRQADPFDKRRAFMALSPGARHGMRDYFMALKRGGPFA